MLELPREILKVDAQATLYCDPLNQNLWSRSQALLFYKASPGNSPGQQRQPLPHKSRHFRASGVMTSGVRPQDTCSSAAVSPEARGKATTSLHLPGGAWLSWGEGTQAPAGALATVSSTQFCSGMPDLHVKLVATLPL